MLVLVLSGTGRMAFFRPDSGPPLVRMLVQRKKANSLVQAIFFPSAWPFFGKKGGIGIGIRCSFPCGVDFRRICMKMHNSAGPCLLAKSAETLHPKSAHPVGQSAL